jgi:prephenate dehydrogenase
LASAGFESTVRLAKSNPAMWVPIFKQNRDNVLDVLNEHITQLRKFKSCLEKENYEYLLELIVQANKIRGILKTGLPWAVITHFWGLPGCHHRVIRQDFCISN